MSWLENWSPWRLRDRADFTGRLLLRIQDEGYNRESKLRDDLRLADESKDHARKERDEAYAELARARDQRDAARATLDQVREALARYHGREDDAFANDHCGPQSTMESA